MILKDVLYWWKFQKLIQQISLVITYSIAFFFGRWGNWMNVKASWQFKLFWFLEGCFQKWWNWFLLSESLEVPDCSLTVWYWVEPQALSRDSRNPQGNALPIRLSIKKAIKLHFPTAYTVLFPLQTPYQKF